MRIAYETLPASLKDHIQGLTGEHHAFHSRMLLGAYMQEDLAAIPPAVWPLVRRQQRTGRDFLFASVHVREVLGMSLAEGRMLISDLLDHATEPQRHYRHQWQEGDLVMWDTTASPSIGVGTSPSTSAAKCAAPPPSTSPARTKRWWPNHSPVPGLTGDPCLRGEHRVRTLSLASQAWVPACAEKKGKW